MIYLVSLYFQFILLVGFDDSSVQGQCQGVDFNGLTFGRDGQGTKIFQVPGIAGIVWENVPVIFSI